MEIIASWFLYFIIYSILGWAAETVYCSIPQKHFVERGFLRGPLCPIYGAGAVIILRSLEPYIDNIPALFILGLILTSILEYITSFLMEKLFHMRWWDYSEHRFHINGRVCLLNSVLFGLLCVVLTEVIHPPIEDLVHRLPDTALFIIAAALFLLFIADVIVSVHATIRLKNHLEKLREAEEQIRLRLEEHKEKREEQKERIKEQLEISADLLKERITESGEELKEQLEAGKAKRKETREQRAEQFRAEKEELKEYFKEKSARLTSGEKYLLRSFPHMKSSSHTMEQALEHYRDIMNKDRPNQKKK
ncbi:MAG: hypothetical protein ACI3W6_00950 [Clostridia bacterium]